MQHKKNERVRVIDTQPPQIRQCTPQLSDTVRTETIAVVGLGYVGLPLALAAEENGYRVIGHDIDNHLLGKLQSREAPDFLNTEDRARASRHSITITPDTQDLQGSDAIIVCVPTPVSESYVPDLRALTQACEAIAPHLRRETLVIIESTINPGVCEEVIIPILERGSKLVVERDFLLAHCPERINPGDNTWTVRTIPRVLGAAGPRSLARAQALYERILEAQIFPMQSIKEAEAVKMVENAFRDINIAFVNELAMSFQKLGIDATRVIEGASTKPFSFMPHFPGCGVGGHCIPVDPYYLINYAKQNGFHHRFLETAREINNNMPKYTVDLVEASLSKRGEKLAGKKIALLGMSYKADVPDIRESPSLIIERELIRRGAVVASFDPHLPEFSSTPSLEQALDGASAIVLATGHTMFRALTPLQVQMHGIPILVDGRNFFNKEQFEEAGIHYTGIGR